MAEALYENITQKSVVVTTASQQLSPAGARLELIITNTSTAGQNLTLRFGGPAVAGAGIFLVPYSTYYVDASSGFTPTQQEIYVISSAAAGSVSLFERR